MKKLLIVCFAVIGLAVFAAKLSVNHNQQSSLAHVNCTNDAVMAMIECGGCTNQIIACGGCTNQLIVCGSDTNKLYACGDSCTNKLFACGGCTNSASAELLALQ